MLDDLVQTLETIAKRIHSHGSDLSANETRTRMALIDPLLTALGWDTTDPALVTPEYYVGAKKADYALRTDGPQPAMFIEAKKLHERLDEHREQMTLYSNMAGVKYAALTDGNRWEVYEVFKPTSLDERRVIDLSISSTPAYRCALEFLLLWRSNLSSGYPTPAREPGLAPMTSAKEIGLAPTTSEDKATSTTQTQTTPKHTDNTPGEIPIRATFKKTPYNAVLQADGVVRLPNGRYYAASPAINHLTGRHMNGWDRWHYYDAAAQKWRPINSLPNAAAMKDSGWRLVDGAGGLKRE